MHNFKQNPLLTEDLKSSRAYTHNNFPTQVPVFLGKRAHKLEFNNPFRSVLPELWMIQHVVFNINTPQAFQLIN